MESYKRHHYVPQWYQYRFFNGDEPEKKFFYLDMKPETVHFQDGRSYKRKSLLKWGPPKCFFKEDLYTTRFRDFQNRDIEEKFFGKKDANGKETVEYFSIFQHPSANGKAFESLLLYMSTQKLRTPKGLLCLTSLTGETN